MIENQASLNLLLRTATELSPSTAAPCTIKFFGRALSGALVGPQLGSNAAPTSDEIIKHLLRYGINLCLPKQVHGASVVEAIWDGVRPEADALIAPKAALRDGFCIGVITADCVPAVLVTRTKVAVVHAGWRGLAARILSKTAAQLAESLEYCAIGPCAGPTQYEVGPEVIEAIGAHVCYSSNDRVLLDLASTALSELAPWLGGATISRLTVCTISDERFYSYRRDGAGAGRNLTLVGALGIEQQLVTGDNP